MDKKFKYIQVLIFSMENDKLFLFFYFCVNLAC